MATKAMLREQEEAIERLRKWSKPGDTVNCILRHVSRSGMLRVIDLNKVTDERVYSFGWNAAKAVGYTYDRDREGVRVGGCGMDMGFHLVYELSHRLFPDGFGCIGQKCPSNDHSNGDRDYSPHDPLADDAKRLGFKQERTRHWHNSGGYALRHRWL